MGDRLDAAIKGTGKSREEIAAEANTTVQTISKITTGAHDNPELQLLIRLARAANTTVGALLGESITISTEDEDTLLGFRHWIDEKLTTIDARKEPNAVIEVMRSEERRTRHVADRPVQSIENPFDAKVTVVLRARGESMRDDGILPNDALYAVAPNGNEPPVGKIIACSIGDDVFVKRLVAEHHRYYLRSAHPRYRSFEVELAAESFRLLGIVIGRTGLVAEP